MVPEEGNNSAPAPEPEPEALEHFGSVAALLASCPTERPLASGRRVRLAGLTVLDKRKVSKDALCFCTVSDRASAGARVGLRLGRGHGPGDLAPAGAAAAIRGCRAGVVIAAIEGLLVRDESGRNAGRLLVSCERVELVTASTIGGAAAGQQQQPTLLFDLNYCEEMDHAEFEGLCRQLRLSYSTNRRSAHAFQICLAGSGLAPPAIALQPQPSSTAPKVEAVGAAADGGAGRKSALWATAVEEKWDNWGATLLDDSAPWTRPEYTGRVVYLAAESPHVLQHIEPDCTYVIGGLVDHKAKPGLSFERAEAFGLRTARLPLEDFLTLRGATEGGGDISTLAVVQLLLLRREHEGEGGWGAAVSSCPALQCAPLRKFVRWKPPYTHLNDAPRPSHGEWLDGWHGSEGRIEGARG